MNKRVGAEALFGIGGGTVSEVSHKNLQIAEDLCRKCRPNDAVPYLNKALEADITNLDAWIQMAFLAPNFNESLETLQSAEKIGRKKLLTGLGPKCFDDNGDKVGHFWGILETRPYMRVLQTMYVNAANTIIEMLRLCPGDNLGQRDWLGSTLIQAGRYSQALSFVQAWLQSEVVRTGEPLPRGGCTFEDPSREPLSAVRVEELSDFVNGALVYSGALAAFKLWGDCELARQYLLIATKLNPAVILKVLAKVDRPKEPNRSARSMNGPKDANDYLWLTQNLWMAEDVWKWADSQENVKTLVLQKCSRDGCNNMETRVAEYKRCSACHEVRYCGIECQKADWKSHKPKCQEHQRLKQTLKAITQGRPLPKNGMPFFGASADFSGKGVTTKFYG